MFPLIRYIITYFLLFFSISAYAQIEKDTVFFSNGGVLIGKIKKAKLGILTFDPDDANDVTIQLRKIKTISAAHKIFRIETINHDVYFGRIWRGGNENTIDLRRFADTLKFSLENVSILYPFETSVGQRFSGSVGLGYSYTRSSGLGRLNFDGSVSYVSRKDEVSFSFSGIYTVYDSLFSRDKEGANLKYNYYFAKEWFTTLFLGYQRNIELGLKRRYQEGVGIGNKFLKKRSLYAWARTGLSFNQEESMEGVKSQLLTEVFGQFEMNIFKFEKPKLSLSVQQSLYYSLTQTDRFRNDGSVNIVWELFKDFNLSFEPYNNFDSKPPVSDSPQFDYGIVLGIKYTF